MIPLPRIMIAPNGARLTKAEHPALPVTIAEIVETAKACHAAGADGLHAHVRDDEQRHVLDAGLYRELITEMRHLVVDMMVQITTEAIGQYSPESQMQLVRTVEPQAVSVAFRELEQAADQAQVQRFYCWADEAGIAVQHILYDVDDIRRWAKFMQGASLNSSEVQALLVLGRYAPDHLSVPQDIDPLLRTLKQLRSNTDWAICAFGSNETACLKRAVELGGKARIGFENNMYCANGTISSDNAGRVAELVTELRGIP